MKSPRPKNFSTISKFLPFRGSFIERFSLEFVHYLKVSNLFFSNLTTFLPCLAVGTLFWRSIIIYIFSYRKFLYTFFTFVSFHELISCFCDLKSNCIFLWLKAISFLSDFTGVIGNPNSLHWTIKWYQSISHTMVE